MKIEELFPISPGHLGGDVFEILSSWLKIQKDNSGANALRLMSAFKALEKTGDLQNFKNELYKFTTAR